MNKSILALLITTITFAVSSCTIQPSNNQTQNNQIPQKEIQSTKTLITGNYLGSDYKGNYVWGGAMNLAWTELNENIIKEKSQLKTENKVVLEMVDKLNNPVFTKNDLDEESYYVKSGYGQKTVDIINKESREKFPSKSFADLVLDLSPKDIISYAYFLKEVKYDTEFDKKDVIFNDQKVKGFIAINQEQRDTVKIIKYESDEKFIIRLKLKDQSDQLILAKGYDMTHSKSVIDEINQNRNNNHPSIGENDVFSAPIINLDYKRDYTELVGIPFANNKFQDYAIK